MHQIGKEFHLVNVTIHQTFGLRIKIFVAIYSLGHLFHCIAKYICDSLRLCPSMRLTESLFLFDYSIFFLFCLLSRDVATLQERVSVGPSVGHALAFWPSRSDLQPCTCGLVSFHLYLCLEPFFIRGPGRLSNHAPVLNDHFKVFPLSEKEQHQLHQIQNFSIGRPWTIPTTSGAQYQYPLRCSS